MTDKTIVGIYIRVSTQEQASEGYSIKEQEERLKKYAEAQGWIIKKVYSDPGHSGAKRDRPALNQMIKDVMDHKLNKILVYKLDRLSRSQKDTLYLIEDIFIKYGVDFVSMTENFDTGTPLGRAMVGILSVFAQLERENIKERITVGRDARAKEGYYHGGAYDPIGYDYVDGDLIVNEYEALQIKKIWDLVESGASLHSIHTRMTELGYKHKYGAWIDQSVRTMLTNVLYTGRIAWKGDIYDGRHEAIIDRERFENMQRYLKDRDVGGLTRSPYVRKMLLAGVAVCGNCGAVLHGGKGCITKDNPNGVKYYRCSSRINRNKRAVIDPTCRLKGRKAEELDNIVIDEIRKLVIDPDYFNNIIKTDIAQDTTSEDIRVLNDRIEEIERQTRKLVDLYAIGSIDFTLINDKIKTLADERTALESEIDKLKVVKAPNLSIKDARAVLTTFSEITDNASHEEMVKIIQTLIRKVAVSDDGVTIYWTFV